MQGSAGPHVIVAAAGALANPDYLPCALNAQLSFCEVAHLGR
jgi:hypothetical protein